MKRLDIVLIVILAILILVIGLGLGALGYVFKSADSSKTDLVSNLVQPTAPQRESRGWHQAYAGSLDFYEQAYQNLSNQTSGEDLGAIVNHHLLAKNFIAETLSKISSPDIETIVLISPNHFDNGQSNILTSESDWSTVYGDLLADQDLIDVLGISAEEDVFTYEHGIFNIVTFIKKSFPEAKIVPIVVKEKTPQADLDILSAKLALALSEKSLVIGSFDFSHELPNSVAYWHDQQAETIIKNFASQDVANLDIDSRQGLYLVLELLKKLGAKSFTKVNHSSANTLLNIAGDNTSYLTGYFTKQTAGPEQSVYLRFVGDMFFDRYIRKPIAENGIEYPLANMQRYFMGGDLNIGNLEGPITDKAPQALDPNNTTFTFQPEIADLLDDYELDLVSLANNHTLNYNQAGLSQTYEYLDQAGIAYFGEPFNKDNLAVIKDIRGTKIAFIGYHQLFSADSASVISEIKSLSEKSDYQIVYAHWGNEYTNYPSQSQKNLAHQFVEAGADIVIGSHPHVIQGLEIYQNKPIFYSLGNFIFDQIQTGTKEGLTLGVELNPEYFEFTLWPIVINKFQVTLANSEEYGIILNKFAEISDLSAFEKSSLKAGKIKINFN